MFSADFSLGDGSIFTVNNAYALYEIEDMEAIWRHTDYSCDWTTRVQVQRRLGRTDS